jgi:hypothetical protein
MRHNQRVIIHIYVECRDENPKAFSYFFCRAFSLFSLKFLSISVYQCKTRYPNFVTNIVIIGWRISIFYLIWFGTLTRTYRTVHTGEKSVHCLKLVTRRGTGPLWFPRCETQKRRKHKKTCWQKYSPKLGNYTEQERAQFTCIVLRRIEEQASMDLLTQQGAKISEVGIANFFWVR